MLERIEHCNGLGDRNKLGDCNKLGDRPQARPLATGSATGHKLGHWPRARRPATSSATVRGSASTTEHMLECIKHDST